MNNTKVADMVFLKIAKRLHALDGTVIKAGFMSGAYPSGTSIAYVAAIQEYGDPSHHIPPRPFMRPAMKHGKAQWTAQIREGVKSLIRDNRGVASILDPVGGSMAAEIQEQIAAVTAPPLSPVTVMLRGMKRHKPQLQVSGRTVGEAAQRVAAGKTNYGASTKPLVDTGAMLASVTYKVGKA